MKASAEKQKKKSKRSLKCENMVAGDSVSVKQEVLLEEHADNMQAQVLLPEQRPSATKKKKKKHSDSMENIKPVNGYTEKRMKKRKTSVAEISDTPVTDDHSAQEPGELKEEVSHGKQMVEAGDSNKPAHLSKKEPQNTLHSGAHDNLMINKEFAGRYEESKRKEILRNNPGITAEFSDSESSVYSSEDEFGELLTKRVDGEVNSVIKALLEKDPRVYDGKTQFFSSRQPAENSDSDDDGDRSESDDDNDGDDGESGQKPKAAVKKRKSQPVDSDDEPLAGWDTIAKHAEERTPKVTMKDYVRENLLKHGKLGEDDESDEDSRPDDDNEDLHPENQGKAQWYFDATGDFECEPETSKADGDDEEFFKKREKTADEVAQEEKDFEEFLEKKARQQSRAAGEDLLLHSYLEKETPDDKERFLRDFILNNGWIDKKKSDAPSHQDYTIEMDLPMGDGEGDANPEDDDNFQDKVDNFEKEYNFRFEDPDAPEIVFHSRKVDGSIRRPDDRRKRAREAKKKRKQEEKVIKTEEVKRLKNLKKSEIQSRLLAIQEAAGEGLDLSGMDLDGDFIPEEFDRQMQSKFGDDYYSQADTKMEELTKEGVACATEKRLPPEIGEDVPQNVREDVNQLMDEYYNLDYEDIVGGQPMRFNYKRVDPESFNLTSKQILEMDDKDLRSLVSVKYLAPYRSKRDVQKKAWRVKAALDKRRRSLGNAQGNGSQNDAHVANDVAKPGKGAGSRKRKRGSSAVHEG